MQVLAVISVTVALLGGPQWFPGAPLVSQGMVFKGPGGVIEIPAGDTTGRRLQGLDLYYSPLLATGMQLSGDKTMHDTAAGLTTIIGPSEGTIKRLFEESVRSEADIQKATVKVDPQLWHWQQRQFEFLWPQGRPQYYLEQVEQDLYRRIELADKGGYTVSVQPGGRPPEVTVAVEFTKRTLSGGKYDETIRAFVGRPTLIKAIVTATAPLARDQKTLLLWQPSPEMQVLASGSAGVPEWAVGDWQVDIPPREDDRFVMTLRRFVLTVHADGTLSTDVAPANGFIGPRGQVEFTWEGEDEPFTGRLNPDGTGSGSYMIKKGTAVGTRITWTATRTDRSGQVADLKVVEIPPLPAPTVQVLEAARRLTGVAVLLEFTPRRED